LIRLLEAKRRLFERTGTGVRKKVCVRQALSRLEHRNQFGGYSILKSFVANAIRAFLSYP
jgi:hypothetical protein